MNYQDFRKEFLKEANTFIAELDAVHSSETDTGSKAEQFLSIGERYGIDLKEIVA